MAPPPRPSAVSANRSDERRRAHAESAAGLIFIACARVALARGDTSVAGRRAGTVVATLEAAVAESGPSGKTDHYARTGENGDGRPHSLRQPKAGHESAQESGWGNHGPGWHETHRPGRQQFRTGPQATGPRERMRV